MVTLPQLRSYMREQAIQDRNRRSIQVTAETIEAALEEASVELDLPVKRLEKGSRGVFGMNRKNYILIVYEAERESDEEGDGDLGIDFDAIGIQEDAEENIDGEAIVRLSADGVLLKVTRPPTSPAQRSEIRSP